MLLMILIVKNLLEHFMEKNYKTQIKNNLGLKKKKRKKEIMKKRNKLYVKWKGCDNSFNSRTDKKDIEKLII